MEYFCFMSLMFYFCDGFLCLKLDLLVVDADATGMLPFLVSPICIRFPYSCIDHVISLHVSFQAMRLSNSIIT
jgi:hypothetical protein